MRKMTVLGSMVIGLLILASSGFADEGGAHGIGSTHMKVSGVVKKVQSDVITVKTPWGVDEDRFFRHT